jgi:hypothetical protein
MTSMLLVLVTFCLVVEEAVFVTDTVLSGFFSDVYSKGVLIVIFIIEVVPRPLSLLGLVIIGFGGD